jgi:hypothetical protein
VFQSWEPSFHIHPLPITKVEISIGQLGCVWYDVSLLYNEFYLIVCCQVVKFCMVDSTCRLIFPETLCNNLSNEEGGEMISPTYEVFDPSNDMKRINSYRKISTLLNDKHL